jgi:hypothetical protein
MLQRYRRTLSDEAREYLRRDMEIELLHMLADGKLIALALQDGAPFDKGPVKIPRYLFPVGITDSVEIDWDNSSIKSAGARFVQVRIQKEGPRTVKPVLLGRRRSLPATKTVVAEGNAKPSKLPTNVKKRTGRPSVSAPLEELVRGLIGRGELSGRSRKEQLDIVGEAARKTHPKLFPKPKQPAPATIIRALRATGHMS